MPIMPIYKKYPVKSRVSRTFKDENVPLFVTDFQIGDEKLQSEEYKRYIRSPEWEQKKQERMKIDHYSCVMCGRSREHCRTLQVHHITYKNLGHENVYTDLCTVCGSCHKKLHNYYDRIREATA